MENKQKFNKIFSCKFCINKYSCKASLCNHIRIKHKQTKDKVCNTNDILLNNLCNTNNILLNNLCNTNNILNNNSISNTNNILNKKLIVCIKCNRQFNHRQCKYKHEKICKNNINQKNIEQNNIDQIKLEEIKLEQIKLEEIKLEEIKLEQLKEETNILKLKLKLNNKKNITSFKSLNNMLMNKNYMANSNNTTNNIINNNIQLISYGKEEIPDTLTIKDKKQILNAGNLCLEKLIEITNCGVYNQFKNIIITNLKDNYVYKYDEKLGFFTIANKTDTLNDLINNRVMDIEEIYNELTEANKINIEIKNKIKMFLEKIQNEENKFTDHNENITYDNYKNYKINKIKILLYNNNDKITKDIALYYMPY
jgi:hypothetical protein